MVAQIILSLSILVGLHEMGHLLAAKYFGMRVEQFSIGFPPKLFKFNYGETEYAISAIPLGGYVKISGMIDESLDTDTLSEEPQPWEFRSKPAWQRLIVMLGGIIVNVITGIVIFIGITYMWGDTYFNKGLYNDNGGIMAYEFTQEIGLKSGDKITKINGNDYEDIQEIINPANLLSENASYTVLRDGKEIVINIPGDFIENFSGGTPVVNWMRFPAVIGSVSPGSLAEKLGFEVNDTFTSINGSAVTYQDEVMEILRSRTQDSLFFTLNRKGEELAFKVSHPADSTVGFYPLAPTEEFIKKYEERREYGFFASIPLGTERAFSVVFLQIKAFGKMFSGELNPIKSLSGPVGIAKLYGTEWDWFRFWRITGLLSMILAFMNLLPIPALDGGHVVFLSAEIISGRKPSDKFLEVAQKIGMVLLLALMVFIIGNDIIKLF